MRNQNYDEEYQRQQHKDARAFSIEQLSIIENIKNEAFINGFTEEEEIEYLRKQRQGGRINMNTQIRVRCNKISMQEHYTKKDDGTPNLQATIELGVHYTNDPNNPNYPYAQLSSGTVFPLNTINQEVIDGFRIGNEYMISITEA